MPLWTTEDGKRIYAEDEAAMKLIATTLFYPEVPLSAWTLYKEQTHARHDHGTVYHYPEDF